VKIPVLAWALLCFFAAPELMKTQASQALGDFKGLHRVAIAIERLSKADEDMGLTRDSLKDQILVALRRDIPKLEIISGDTSESSAHPAGAMATVYLAITSGHFGKNVASHVQIELLRGVEIIGDDGAKYFAVATVWSDGGLGIDSVEQMPSRIRDRISQAMTAFAAEYYKEKPVGGTI
jgi:hypothetical protein